MINILFVDDEPNILSGLERMLRSVRNEWNMMFAPGGNEALAIFAEKPIDVVVSDMKMPGMDGSEFLETVREKYPKVVRIILSGYSEKEMIIKSVGTAHQYLSKPCDSETLKATVNRVCELNELLTNDNLRGLVSKLPTVPSLPLLYSELIDELGKDEPSTNLVSAIVKQDIGMTSKILQIVNSAFFGLSRSISDPKGAVEILGLDTISSLTLGLGLISQFDKKISGVFLTNIWDHSMAVGTMAKKIAHLENQEIVNDAFTAGLLHNIGKVVLAINFPPEFASLNKIVKEEGISLVEAERHVFKATSSEVGAYLLGLWGLRREVVQAVTFHNHPSDSRSRSFSAITAIHVADAFQNYVSGRDSAAVEPAYDMDYLSSIGVSHKIPLWQDRCSENREAEEHYREELVYQGV